MRARLIAVLVASVVASGCYAPNPPSGAYECASDGACPTSQSCVCGMCVRNPKDAVCNLKIETSSASLSVVEHQAFPITVTALYDKSDPASVALGYEGTVSLSFELVDGSKWADVTPATLKLQNGTATTMVSLNRETAPPQTPHLVGRLQSQRFPSSAVVVTAPPLVRDITPIVAPLTLFQKFGWVQYLVAFPSLRRDADRYRMYFSGIDSQSALSLGVATSTDGKTFTPTAAPILVGVPKPAMKTDPPLKALAAPQSYEVDGVTQLVFSESVELTTESNGIVIKRSTSTDGLTAFSTPVPLITCADGPDFCRGRASFGTVIQDPDNADGRLMYFVGQSTGLNIAAIGLARSLDGGKTFVVEPSPVLNGDLGGEAVLASPQVVVEGSVYKMWYSFVRARDFGTQCNLAVGYATSNDGVYWVRSPSNSPMATIEGASGGGWDSTNTAFYVSSVLPAVTGQGYELYYTAAKQDFFLGCVPNGVGRATRP